MPTFTLKPSGNNGVDLTKYDITDIAYYDDWAGNATTIRFFDDANNYTQFTGSGIKVTKTSTGELMDVTAGTIDTFQVSIGGVRVISATNLNLSAATLFDFYQARYALGAVDYLLSGADMIHGTEFRDILSGFGGDDRIYGYGGIDVLDGGAGNDVVLAGAGWDTVFGGSGNDRLYGEEDVDRLYGGDGNDILVGGHQNDFLDGGDGNDDLSGGDATDNLRGGGGSDRISAGHADDRLSGGAGNDRLYGGDHWDRLEGGTGLDKLYGGTGKDRFVFSSIADSTLSVSGQDTIYDFSQSEFDTIDVRLIDANVNVAKGQAFDFIGAAAFSGEAGELRYANTTARTYVQGDVDGDGAADFQIWINSVVTLISTDFVL
ncbi:MULTISPECIES: calcium-binding protein [unclassified Rhizobium]|uniref:calcium-binding protein n=1 Tax=unclassified Rhizobium TaxID=2613769 RepID=UPI000712BCAA|nr:MULTISPECIES: calcium-binding protein [unclassified Rhizobium]KQS93389.1 hypothetical protein ASG50_27795 [Rhizobium sp. Leaf386]KQT03230.1 hypothetical protein ASG42_24800 [Rhizobium sp. Leaf391]KQU08361.1 hypothetical protein ASG68_22485 [Rhizobium sp. Leaf453]